MTTTRADALPPLPAELSADQLIGERVHMQMFRSRVTQVRMAADLGIQQSALSRKLRGKRPWLASEVMLVARSLGVAYTDLMPGPGEATDPTPTGPASGAVTGGKLTGERHLVAVDSQVVADTSSRCVPAAVVTERDAA